MGAEDPAKKGICSTLSTSNGTNHDDWPDWPSCFAKDPSTPVIMVATGTDCPDESVHPPILR